MKKFWKLKKLPLCVPLNNVSKICLVEMIRIIISYTLKKIFSENMGY